jgi:hypothetical protein
MCSESSKLPGTLSLISVPVPNGDVVGAFLKILQLNVVSPAFVLLAKKFWILWIRVVVNVERVALWVIVTLETLHLVLWEQAAAKLITFDDHVLLHWVGEAHPLQTLLAFEISAVSLNLVDEPIVSEESPVDVIKFFLPISDWSVEDSILISMIISLIFIFGCPIISS